MIWPFWTKFYFVLGPNIRWAFYRTIGLWFSLFWLGILKWTQVPSPNAKKYCKAANKYINCEECKNRFHASCTNLGESKLLELKSGNGSWYCTCCKADCGLSSGVVLYGHKAVQCGKCEMRIHNKCSLISDSEFEPVENTNCTWICRKCDFFNFLDSFFTHHLNLENQNRFDTLAKDSGIKTSQTGLVKTNLSEDWNL